MPFDGTNFDKIKVPFCFTTATPDERMLELARLLENESEWRDSVMEWDFSCVQARFLQLGHCGTAGCAVGLAALMWPEFESVYQKTFIMRTLLLTQFFNLTNYEFRTIFASARLYGVDTMMHVQPYQVAGAIREFVAARQAKGE